MPAGITGSLLAGELVTFVSNLNPNRSGQISSGAIQISRLRSDAFDTSNYQRVEVEFYTLVDNNTGLRLMYGNTNDQSTPNTFKILRAQTQDGQWLETP